MYFNIIPKTILTKNINKYESIIFVVKSLLIKKFTETKMTLVNLPHNSCKKYWIIPLNKPQKLS